MARLAARRCLGMAWWLAGSANPAGVPMAALTLGRGTGKNAVNVTGFAIGQPMGPLELKSGGEVIKARGLTGCPG